MSSLKTFCLEGIQIIYFLFFLGNELSDESLSDILKCLRNGYGKQLVHLSLSSIFLFPLKIMMNRESNFLWKYDQFGRYLQIRLSSISYSFESILYIIVLLYLWRVACILVKESFEGLLNILMNNYLPLLATLDIGCMELHSVAII